LSTITRLLTERLGVAWANVYDYHPDERQLEVLAFYQVADLGIDTDGWIGKRLFCYDNSSWASALQDRRPVIWYADAPSLSEAEVAERKSWGELSSITAPLIFRDAVVGLLDVGEARSVRRFDRDDVLVAQAIADHAAIAIDNARTRAQLVEQATTDGLTGLHNRRYLEERLAQEVAEAERYGHPLSVLMIDVDDFKVFNDTFGHPQGDRLLQEIAQLMRDVTRRGVDLVARYGGEEFVIVLPNTPTDGEEHGAAMSVAERLRSLVASRLFEGWSGRRDVRATISVGVAGRSRKVASPSAVLTCADKALYQAKRTGKDRVCMHAC
jgi:diguanylate cyclase (GGDEF)-like protein